MRPRIPIIVSTLGLLAVAIGVQACQGKQEPVKPDPVKVTGISISATSLTMTEGETQTLTASVTPSNADNKGISWSTSKATVVTVDDGKITAVKKGTATITAKSADGGKTATCSITVNAKSVSVTGVSLDKTSVELTEGEEVTLTATIAPETATNKNVSWSSSDEKVATVKDGKITGVKAGTAKITVKTEDGGKTAECSVKVNAKVISVESVSLDKASIELEEGEDLTLVASVKPDNASNKNVSWSSSDEKIAIVKDGKVSAVKEGSAKITVTTEDGQKTSVCSVTVKTKVKSVESVFLDKSSIELTEGDSSTLAATVKPDNATNKSVTWSSSDSDVATVDTSGKVTATKEGSAVITVTTVDGSKKASCNVIVTKRSGTEGVSDNGEVHNWN